MCHEGNGEGLQDQYALGGVGRQIGREELPDVGEHLRPAVRAEEPTGSKPVRASSEDQRRDARGTRKLASRDPLRSGMARYGDRLSLHATRSPGAPGAQEVTAAQQEEDQDQRDDLTEIEHPHRQLDLLSQPARADETQNGRGPHRAFPR